MIRFKRFSAFLVMIVVTNFSMALAQPSTSGEMDGDDFAWYFNKQGVALSQYQEDFERCRRIVAIKNGGDQKKIDQRGLVPTLIWSGIAPGIENADFSNCMIVSGYRRIDVQSMRQRVLSEKISTMSDIELHDLVSTDSIQLGEIGKIWTNDQFSVQPNTPMAKEHLDFVEPFQILQDTASLAVPAYLKRISAKLLTPNSKIDAELATLVFSLAHDGKRGRFDSPYITFTKRDSKTGNIPLSDGDPQVFRIANYKEKKLIDGYQVIQINPGQYALWINRGNGGRQIQYCLKTIAFNVSAGDILYLGDWTAFNDRRFTVEVDKLDKAREIIENIRSTQSQNMQVVEFQNGATLPCNDNDIFGVELPN